VYFCAIYDVSILLSTSLCLEQGCSRGWLQAPEQVPLFFEGPIVWAANGACDALTDTSGAEMVKFGKSDRTRFSMLNWNLWHTWEYYGNVVVYLRMKGLVPPSSERMQMMQMK
jgi:hypothetical protein